MAKTLKQISYQDAVTWFRDHGFELTEAPGASNRVFLRKYKVSAALERMPDANVKIFAYPGYVIGGEISKLVDLGHQKVLRTTKAFMSVLLEIAALSPLCGPCPRIPSASRPIPERELRRGITASRPHGSAVPHGRRLFACREHGYQP